MSGRAGAAVGVFDSGIGGLTVVRELIKVLPEEPIVYLGDTARVPYGNKSRETVVKFSTENVLFLLQHDVKLVIVACHTASSFALPFLERHFKHPILGVIEPGVEMALEVTRSGRIGVIGTQATVGSGAYPHSFAHRNRSVRLTQAACPLFVPLVEEGLPNDPVAREMARRYLRPFTAARVDTLILGCTHYPLLKRTISEVMGPKVRLIDSARQVALKAKVILGEMDLAAGRGRGRGGGNGSSAPRRFYVTDEPRHFEALSVRFLGRRLGDVSRVDVAKV
ncbi:MAG: glutamate racemase [Candidatus Omnitrophica bacterium]|nr:glutamate racemase [Candidatus Omnitrophota bacterium]